MARGGGLSRSVRPVESCPFFQSEHLAAEGKGRSHKVRAATSVPMIAKERERAKERRCDERFAS